MNRKKLFIKDGTRDETVVLNFQKTPEKEFTLYAEAYHQVAKEAVSVLERNKQAGIPKLPIDDFRAYPVVFLYRHALELYMKSVILVGAPMLEIKDVDKIDCNKLLDTHSLDSLRQKIEKVFLAFEWDWDLGTPQFKTLEDFRKIISELHQVDTGSSTFRYPVDKKINASLPFNFEFNLVAFCKTLDCLLPVLEDATYTAYEDLQSYTEIMSEFNNEV